MVDKVQRRIIRKRYNSSFNMPLGNFYRELYLNFMGDFYSQVQSSERLAHLLVSLNAPPCNPVRTTRYYYTEGFKGGPHYSERREIFELPMHLCVGTENCFQYLIKPDRNEIVFTIFRLLLEPRGCVRLLFQINLGIW